jgi:putative transposase
LKDNNSNNEIIRIKAIDLYNNNWKVTNICKTLHCTRPWFYKWLKRYDPNDPNWFKEQSRAPKTILKQYNNEMEQLILETRNKLLSRPYLQYGPQAIYYSLIQENKNPPPVWTIARILKRNNLTRTKRSTSYISKGKNYPYNFTMSHQMDFVGPRYLYIKSRFYFHTIICCDTHYARIQVSDNLRSESVCENLIHFWKEAGIPDFLQMDNDLSFWGSLNKPNALGKVIRICLLHKVIPVFIPIKEPWRNGIIEHFNKKMQSAILASKKYNKLDEIQQTSNKFCDVHNQCHYYSSQNGMSPNKQMEYLNYPPVKLDKNYTIDKRSLPIENGEIYVIRFIRSDLKFHLFGLSFLLPEEAQYEYIKGVIITQEHRIIFFKDQKYITEYKFILY